MYALKKRRKKPGRDPESVEIAGALSAAAVGIGIGFTVVGGSGLGVGAAG